MKSIVLHGFTKGIVDICKQQYSLTWIANHQQADVTYMQVRDGFSLPSEVNKIPVNIDLYEYVSKNASTIYECYSRHHYMKVINRPLVQYYNHLMMIHTEWAFSLLSRLKPDVIIFSNIPHEGYDNVLLIVAKYLKIKVICLYQVPFAPSHWIYELSGNEMAKIVDRTTLTTNTSSESYIDEYLSCLDGESVFPYMKNIKPLYNYDSKQCVKDLLRFKIRNLISGLLLWRENKLHEKREKNSVSKFDISAKEFAYFPLHLQPELTTSALGRGIYFNQIKAIKHFTRFCAEMELPVIVKENPKQNFSHRDDLFFDELSTIDNVVYVDRYMNSTEIVKQAVIVGTITGTVGLEALYHRKPVVCYGDAWWKDFSNVYDESTLDSNSLNTKPDLNKFIDELKKKSSEAFDGCSDSDYASRFDIDELLNNTKMSRTIKYIMNYIE